MMKKTLVPHNRPSLLHPKYVKVPKVFKGSSRCCYSKYMDTVKPWQPPDFSSFTCTCSHPNPLVAKVYTLRLAGFLLETYFQMVHNTIGRYETHSLHTAIEVKSQVSNCCRQDSGSTYLNSPHPNGAAIDKTIR